MKLLNYFSFIILGIHFLSDIVEGLKTEQIIGAERAKENEFKFVAALLYKVAPGARPINPCTATIVDDRHVLAVAHCFYDEQTRELINKKFYVGFSLTDIYYPTGTADYRKVDLVIMPAVYNPEGLNGSGKVGNLAVIRLEAPLGLGKGHKTLKKLLTPSRLRVMTEIFTIASFGWNKIVLISEMSFNGTWDQSTMGESDGKLRHAETRLFTREECLLPTDNNLALGNLCGRIVQGHRELKGICQGDSGAPVVSGKFVIALAINGYDECNDNKKPGIYIDLLPYKEFLEPAIAGNFNNFMRVYQMEKDSSGDYSFKLVE